MVGTVSEPADDLVYINHFSVLANDRLAASVGRLDGASIGKDEAANLRWVAQNSNGRNVEFIPCHRLHEKLYEFLVRNEHAQRVLQFAADFQLVKLVVEHRRRRIRASAMVKSELHEGVMSVPEIAERPHVHKSALDAAFSRAEIAFRSRSCNELR